MLIVHVWNELPFLTVHVTIARDDAAGKKIIRLGLKQGSIDGVVMHNETLAPKQRCKVTFREDAPDIEVHDASGFVLGYSDLSETEKVFRIQGVVQ